MEQDEQVFMDLMMAYRMAEMSCNNHYHFHHLGLMHKYYVHCLWATAEPGFGVNVNLNF